MKKTTALSLISVIFMALFVTFCAKPELIDNPNPADNTNITNRTSLDDYAMTTNDITVENGMLCFKDTAAFYRTIESLEILSSDSAYISVYLQSIGITEGEPIPSTINASSDPICQKFDDRLNFYSLREYIDDTNYNLLNTGTPYDRLPYFFIGSPVFRSVLNQYYEVKIGNLIYKLVNDEFTFLITGNDFNILPILRAAQDPLSVGPRHNLFLIDDKCFEDSILHDRIVELAMIGAGCEFSFYTEKTAPNTYTFTNSTAYFGLNSSNANVYWSIKDANGTILAQTSTHSNSFIYTLPTGLPSSSYPLSVTMTHTTPCVGTKTEVFLLFGCDIPLNLTSTSLSSQHKFDGFTYTFTVDMGALQGYSITWNFGDGSSPVTINNKNTVEHTFPQSEGEVYYSVCATIIKDNCSTTISKTYPLGCGESRPPDYEERKPVSGTQYSYEVRLFIDKIEKIRRLGAKIGFFRDNKPENAERLTINFSTPIGPAEWFKGNCTYFSSNIMDSNSGLSWFQMTVSSSEKKKSLKFRDNSFKAIFEIGFKNAAGEASVIPIGVKKLYRNP